MDSFRLGLANITYPGIKTLFYTTNSIMVMIQMIMTNGIQNKWSTTGLLLERGQDGYSRYFVVLEDVCKKKEVCLGLGIRQRIRQFDIPNYVFKCTLSLNIKCSVMFSS